MNQRNCWGCGELLERVTDTPTVIDGHAYCDAFCVNRRDDDEPRDLDAQDRRAASEERLENLRNEH